MRLIRANLQMTGRGSSPRRLVMSEPRPLPDPFGQPVDVLYRFQASSHGQKSSPPSLFADLSELASNSQDSDLGATQPAPAPGLALHPSDLGLPKPSPAVQFCLFSAAPTLHPSPTLRQTSSSTRILRMFYFMAGPTAPFTEVVCGTCLIYFYVRIFKKRRRTIITITTTTSTATTTTTTTTSTSTGTRRPPPLPTTPFCMHCFGGGGVGGLITRTGSLEQLPANVPRDKRRLTMPDCPHDESAVNTE